MEDKINVPHKGLYTDNSYVNQPEGTYSFALNATLESNEGDFHVLSNENSNEIYAFLKPDYVLIGSVYIGDGETCLFSVKNDNTVSEIGILSDKQSFQNTEPGNNYKVLFNDSTSIKEDKLNFRADKQIQATYRLRRGCEKVVYWVDHNNNTGRVDINYINNLLKDGKKPTLNDFRNFNIIREIPVFKSIEVLDNGGFLPPGSISVYIQYLDKDLNPTPFIVESSPILIYHDSIKSRFSEIDGSVNRTISNSQQQFLDYGTTTKSLKIEVDNLDKSFSFYKLGFVLYSNADKTPSEFYLSDVLSIKSKDFTYTGRNHATKATREDFSMFLKNIDLGKSKTVVQKDNRLIVGNVDSSNLDFRHLQKLASKIKTDCVLRESIINSNVDKSNSKSPYNKIVGTGFQPGDIYSLGIVYVFEGNLESPVFHIPGKNSIAGNSTIYDNTPKEGVLKTIGMISGETNTSTIDYLERESCGNFDFWGLDCEGLPLKGNKMRFHRFPSRQEAETLFYEKIPEGTVDKLARHTIKAYFEEEVTTNLDQCTEGSYVPHICIGTKFIDYELEFLKNSQKPEEKSYITFNVGNPISYTTEEMPYGVLPYNFKLRHLVFKGTQVYTRNKQNQNVIAYESFTVDYNTDIPISNNNFTSSISHLRIPEHLIGKQETVVDIDTNTERVTKQWELLEVVDNIQFISDEFGTVGIAKLGSVKIELYRGVAVYDADNLYKTTQFGLHFSNVELPEPIDGNKCIGYYIVAEERNEDSRTIIDSGYLLPTIKNKEYHSLGIWNPLFEQNFDRWKTGRDIKDNFQECMMKRSCPDNWKLRPDGISNNTLALVSPKILFKNEEFNNFTEIEEQLSFKVAKEDVGITGVIVQNVNDYKTENVKNSVKDFVDEDGTTLKLAIVSSQMKTDGTVEGTPLKIINDDTIEKYPLKPYHNATSEDKSTRIFNLDMVNHYLFLHKNNKQDFNIDNDEAVFNNRKIPYVYVKSVHNNFYTKRNQPYYRVTDTIQKKTTCTTFNGDSYVGALRLHNFVMDTPKPAFKCQRSSIWDYLKVIGSIAGAILLTIFTAGTALPLVVGIGSILLATGTAVLGVANIIEKSKFNEVFGENWFKGLNMTIFDDIYHHFFFAAEYATTHPQKAFQDDTIPVYCQVMGDLFFESDFNFSLRVKPKGDKNNFLEPFKPFQKTNHYKYAQSGRVSKTGSCNVVEGNMHYFEDQQNVMVSDSPTEKFFIYRLCDEDDTRKNYQKHKDSNNDSGYKFKGLPMPVFYFKNDDYSVNKKLFTYYEYPIEYSFCSNCVESFPQRFYWSEVSHSESLTDNYKIFLPNNYKDLNGEYGNITNMFTLNNQLYIHTEEGLWLQPTNYQERITDGVVSYIGTGEFGSLPAQLIVDDKSGASAGLQHREAQILTPYGYFFVSERERKIYRFDGKLTPISDLGMTKWFNENIPLVLNRAYRKNNGTEYIYNDNPANKLGTGFILTYDKEKERILVTKKDYFPNQLLIDNQGYELCTLADGVLIFLDIENTIKTLQGNDIDSKRVMLGKATRVTDTLGVSVPNTLVPENKYNFLGIENCEMKFETWVEETKRMCVQELANITVENDTDIYCFFDTSGSFSSDKLNTLRNSMANLEQVIRDINPDWNGTVQKINSGAEKMSNFSAQVLALYNNRPDKEKHIILISFTNEDDTNYNDINLGKDTQYETFLKEFEGKYLTKFKSFRILSYPIFSDESWANQTKGMYYHQLSVMSLHYPELIDTLRQNINSYYVNKNIQQEWNIMMDRVKNNNPYLNSIDKSPYRDWGWRGIFTGNMITQNTDNTLTPESISQEVKKILAPSEDIQVIREVCRDIKQLKQLYVFIPGTPTTTKGIINNSWTISFSLKNNTWTSLHSYIPNFYFRMNEKHFSWLYGNKNIYKHNKPNHFQEFYGEKYPYIVEYVSNDNPIVTKIFDHIRFLTEAYKYDSGLKEYYNERFITFNKAVLYNTRQCSGELNLRVKDITPEQEDYLKLQIVNDNNNVVFLDRNEKDWLLNDFRDYRILYNYPIWNSNKQDITTQNNGKYIDKVINEKSISTAKAWYELESFRDKYLVVRLSFDNFASDIKLLFNFSSEDKTISNY